MSLRPLRADTEDDAAFAYARMAPAAGRWSESPIPRMGVRRTRTLGAPSGCLTWGTFVAFETTGNYIPDFPWEKVTGDIYLTFAETPGPGGVGIFLRDETFTLGEGGDMEDLGGGVWHAVIGVSDVTPGTPMILYALNWSGDNNLTILTAGTCPP